MSVNGIGLKLKMLKQLGGKRIIMTCNVKKIGGRFNFKRIFGFKIGKNLPKT